MEKLGFQIGDLVEIIKEDISDVFTNKIFVINRKSITFFYAGPFDEGWYPSSLRLLSRKCEVCEEHTCPTTEKHPRYWELIKINS